MIKIMIMITMTITIKTDKMDYDNKHNNKINR